MKTQLDFLPILFKKIKIAMQEAAAIVLAKHDLSKIHTMYFMVLYHHKIGLTMKQMSDFINVDKANTTRVITNLVKTQFVVEEETDKIRNKKYRLTEKGMLVATEIQQKNQEIEKKIRQTLSDTEWNDLISLSQKIALIDFKTHF
ncbi:MAG: hypothetical protein PHP41_01285 [Bacilli bacterium]|jgi:DNA-binding MarR family transcriptional regulator|nr:hypothetical protein [Bacilli bacterium]MDY0064049.1 hypothetical protein [Bacilli bacterium]